jgi:hypothetical protein
MASVARAARKPESGRRDSDVLRIQAGRMLTFDELVEHGDISERRVLRKVIKVGIAKTQGLLQLPLSLAICGAFATSGFWHEDPTNEYFVESRLRMQADNIFGDVTTIDDWWSAVLDPGEEGLFGYLFQQTDGYGGDFSTSNEDDPLFGNWARVDNYNQLQAGIRFETTRASTSSFGTTPYTCSTEFECSICLDTQENGFFPLGTVKGGIQENLTQTCSYNRRLEGDEPGEVGAGARRLRLGDMTLRAFLPKFAADDADTFVFHIYPAEPAEKIRSRLQYYRERGWLDADTETVKVSMYFLNAELGRPRLEQLTVQFYFSKSGEIVYERSLLPIFLMFWPPGFYGKISMMADAAFVFLLLLNTGWRIFRVWLAFVKSRMVDHVSQPSTLFEIVILLSGWYCMMNLWSLQTESAKVTEALTEVRNCGLQYHQTSETFTEMRLASEAFTEQARSSALKFYSVSLYWAWYTLALQFRFFVSFGAQPRLALVTNTIRAVLVDLIHFLIVLAPTFLTYAFAGTLLFGRRMRAFSTVPQALMTCFRIMIESEYPWDDLAAEYYITAGIWSWTFIMIVAILMINMVLAIILDVYNEVHENSSNSETIWETMYQVYSRLYYFKTWVPYTTLKAKTDESIKAGQPFIEKDDIRRLFPKMPDVEMNQLYKQCRLDMELASCNNLDKHNLVKLSGAIMSTADKINSTIRKVNHDDAGDPLSSWVEPMVGAVGDGLQDLGKSFLTMPVSSKGRRELSLVATEEEGGAPLEAQVDDPAWFSEIKEMLREQQKWMDHTSWQAQQMQWQIQVAHLNRTHDPTAKPEEVEEAAL